MAKKQAVPKMAQIGKKHMKKYAIRGDCCPIRSMRHVAPKNFRWPSTAWRTTCFTPMPGTSSRPLQLSLAPSWARWALNRVRAFAGDEACGEPEEGNHELGSSEPTRRDHSGVSLCFNGWDRYRSYSTKDTKGSLRFLDPVLYSTCTISMSFSLECEKAHVYGCSTPVILLNNIEQVMEFPWEAILRCTEPGAGPPNAQADGECCFLAWHPVICHPGM